MSRLTGNLALGLFEAYLDVYNPQQLTEEQVWEEVELWVNSLMEEGYDLSDYTWEEMYDTYLQEEYGKERAPGVKPYKPRDRKPLPSQKPLSGETGDGSGYGGVEKFKQDTDADKFKPGNTVPKVKQFGKIFRIIPHGIGAHKDKMTSNVTKITGGDPGEPQAKVMPRMKSKSSKEIVRKTKSESYDLYDVVLSHLLDEGYANSVESAEAIMSNMSEDWVESIVEETAMAKRGYDETAIRNQIAQSTGGGKSADRATALANTKTYGARGTDPKARENLARKQRGDFRKTTSSNPGLHGPGHQSNDPDVEAKQRARGAQRSALTHNEKKSLGR